MITVQVRKSWVGESRGRDGVETGIDWDRLPSSPPPFFLQGAAEAWTVLNPGWESHSLALVASSM